ncbi:FecR family protein [Chitinophaga sp. Cy-1792]|uniref:FecR family protein n=1 Tax=Chitinophaga sp. Cy-1792 TaxID=2608339 RepID=UPI0014214D6F|nr:FecR domain-containing protein [Chitinophaga sp. Cy-1792]NIG55503.1 DUF4974 domain-containing protein [Chitinophaga sp. Cy-1792]
MKEVQQLLSQYRSGRITAEALERLQQLLATGDYDEVLQDDIMHSLRTGVPASDWAPAAQQAVLASILGKQEEAPAPKKVHHLSRWRYAAAAVALLAIAGSGYYYQLRQQPSTPKIAFKRQPMQPGSNKAMLILADGKAVSLDSANTGNIATQGDASIVNTGNSLSYNANGKSAQVVYNTVVTPRGGQFQLGLPDGSKVWLNAASSIRFPTAFREGERRVQISGEAYFQVAANAQQPFFVEVNGNKQLSVQVLGTSFNIMAYNDEKAVTTTLESGLVKVLYKDKFLTLKPGLGASLNEANEFETAAADLEEVLAWKEGKFRFRNTSVQTIMRQISRWYDVDISYEGDLADVRLTGVISRREDAGTLLKILSTTKLVRFEASDNKIQVKPVKE